MLKLKRPEIAEKYECTLEKDTIVHNKAYSGKLSNINEAGAQALAADRNVTYFTEKKAADKTPAKENKLN